MQPVGEDGFERLAMLIIDLKESLEHELRKMATRLDRAIERFDNHAARFDRHLSD